MFFIDTLQTIKARRSTLAFKNDEISMDVLIEIFTYASYAPSHYMTEAWRIKLYQSSGKSYLVNAIINSYCRSGMLATTNTSSQEAIAGFLLDIPHHALIYFEKHADPIRNEEEYSSVAAFIQNAQLAAWEHGVGMLWTITPYMHDEEFIKEIGLDPEKHKVAAVLQIGYPKKLTRAKGRLPVETFMEVIDK